MAINILILEPINGTILSPLKSPNIFKESSYALHFKMEKLGFLQDLPLTFSKDEVTVKEHSNLSYLKKKKMPKLWFYLQSRLPPLLNDGVTVQLEMNCLEAATKEIHSF